jgi:GT2 family glycosyltransferase
VTSKSESPRPNRPPFVLAIMADQQGCGTHRIMIPLAQLVESQVADGRIDMALWPDHVVAAAAPDVIVFQRQVEDGALDTMERWRAMLPDTLFIYELDDYLGEIPSASFHAGFMPPNIEEKVSRGVKLCDRVTTTTEPLAEWMRGLGAKDVRIVPNALPVQKMREREPRMSGKLRIGFAGGMSHGGDLKLIEPAMEAIGDAVEWVFFGARPDDTKSLNIEFHEGMSANAYLDKMAQLDIDLFLAPLEDNAFNRCKSNLRLLESGCVGACVIAQDMTPYHTDSPPLFAYASTPDEWTAAIQKFVASKPAERRKSADALRSWVGRHYVLERNLRKRMDAWLPAGGHWKPDAKIKHREPFIVSCIEERDGLVSRLPFLRRHRIVSTGLESACVEAVTRGSDLLWLRPATAIGEGSWNAVQAALSSAVENATAVPLASDGMNAFPKVDEWMPMSQANVVGMERILTKRFHGKRMSVAAPFGPCVLMSLSALCMLGFPDVEGCGGNEEQAIMEWGLRAAMREWKHIQAADAFASSLAPPPQVTPGQNLRLQARGTLTRLQEPSDSLTVVDREIVELELLGMQWGGPRPGSMGFGTDYESWRALTEAKRPQPEPIKLGRLLHVCRVSFGDPDGIMLRDVPGGWTVWEDDTVHLYDGALDVLMRACNSAGPDVKVIYSDNDSLYTDGKVLPEFKPDFDLELFMAQDYVTPICAVRSEQVFDDRASLYAYVLDTALKHGVKAFAHVPRTLGSMQIHARPEMMAIDALQRQIIVQDTLGESVKVEAHKRIPGCLSVVRNWKSRSDGVGGTVHFKEPPLVSIIVPTLGGGRLLQPCINTIRQHTGYPNYEIIVVLNGSRKEAELGDAANDPRVRVVRWEGDFNWSEVNNWAARFHAKGDFIVTMNDDVCVGSKGWLDAMMGHAVLEDVGTVGAKLLHPAGIVQHVGVVAHRGIAGHLHKGLPNGHPGHLGRALLTHEANAVTGACMLFSRKCFDEVGGFDERFPMNYSDTDFCLRLRQKGYRNIVESIAELLHSEGASRGDPMSPATLRKLAIENAMFAAKHSDVDPYWHPDLMLGLVHGGVFIQGLNAEVLNWSDFAPTDGQGRTLLVNDLPGMKGMTLDVIRAGEVPMAADLSGFGLRLKGPIPKNTAPWDVRDPVRMAEGLRLLGVTRVVVRSLIGEAGAAAPVEALCCFAALDVNVEMRAIEEWMVRPVSDDAADSKVFGFVDREAWALAYAPFHLVSNETAYEYSVTTEEAAE